MSASIGLNVEHSRVKRFLSEIRSFQEFATKTKVEHRNGVPFFINEFWTSKQRQGNRLHEVSYRACFKAQLPAFFISRLTESGEIVLDPFMGRGTTLVEAALLGRVPYGNDVSPLAAIFTEARLNTPTISDVEKRLKEIPWDSFNGFSEASLLVFYHPETLEKIEGLKNWLLEKEKTVGLDSVDKWIRMVAINRLTGHSKGFFSVYTLPPNQAVTTERQRKINEKRQQVPPLRNVPEIILKKSKSLLSQGGVCANNFLISTGLAEDMTLIPDDSVSLVVTSPPFLDIVDYSSDNWLRCWFAGIDPKGVPISRHRSVEKWQEFVARTFWEMSRVMKPNSLMAFEVGEVRNKTVFLEDHVIEATRGLPLQVRGVMVNQQEFTKTANCWGVSNNTVGTNSNRIVLIEKV